MKNPLSERQLLEEFRFLYMTHAATLIVYACRFVDRNIAEDLVQDVYLRLWNKRYSLSFDTNLKSYLYRSVQFACMDYLRHHEIENDFMKLTINRLSLEEVYYQTISDPDKEDRLKKIFKAMETLPSKCKTIFQMAYLEEKKSSEIAVALQLSKRTVEAQLYKALKMIRDIILFIFIFFLFA